MPLTCLGALAEQSQDTEPYPLSASSNRFNQQVHGFAAVPAGGCVVRRGDGSPT